MSLPSSAELGHLTEASAPGSGPLPAAFIAPSLGLCQEWSPFSTISAASMEASMLRVPSLRVGQRSPHSLTSGLWSWGTSEDTTPTTLPTGPQPTGMSLWYHLRLMEGQPCPISDVRHPPACSMCPCQHQPGGAEMEGMLTEGLQREPVLIRLNLAWLADKIPAQDFLGSQLYQGKMRICAHS